MNDDELRAAYAARATEAQEAGGTECPPPEVLQSLVDRTLPEGERVRLVRHVAACPRCRGEIELLRSFGETAERLGYRPAPRRRWPSLAIVAVAVALIALVALFVILYGAGSAR